MPAGWVPFAEAMALKRRSFWVGLPTPPPENFQKKSQSVTLTLTNIWYLTTNMKSTEELLAIAERVKRQATSLDVVEICDAVVGFLQERERRPSSKRDPERYRVYMRDYMRRRRAAAAKLAADRAEWYRRQKDGEG